MDLWILTLRFVLKELLGPSIGHHGTKMVARVGSGS